MRGTRVTGWRRIADALWDAPNDPQIFGAIDVDAGPVQAFISRARAAGHHLTPTHLVGRAIGHSLAAVPEMNVQIRRGRSIPRDTIEVFFITAIAGGHDLSGSKVASIDAKPAIDVARELAERSGRLKSGEDREFTRTKRLMDSLPPRLLGVALRATTLITERMRRDVPAVGLHRTPFGSAMLSSIGVLGLPQAFVPIAWMYDVPLLVVLGEITTKPVVVAGSVQARDVLPITATIDHRYADGWHVSRLMRAFREYLAAPEAFEPLLAPVGETAQIVRPSPH